jgi:hypothetical protein
MECCKVERFLSDIGLNIQTFSHQVPHASARFLFLCYPFLKNVVFLFSMTTLTVNIDNKRTEKALKVVLDAFGLNYHVAQNTDPAGRPLTKAEQAMYNRLERSFKQIKLHQEGKVKLQDAKKAIAEIEAELGK